MIKLHNIYLTYLTFRLIDTILPINDLKYSLPQLLIT
jgi:hypothetical protein